MGCLGCILCQKRLRLSCNVDECKPLPGTTAMPGATTELPPRGNAVGWRAAVGSSSGAQSGS